MTLVIAGYEFDRPSTRSRGEASRAPSEAFSAVDQLQQPTGLFIVADSTITSGAQTLLSGFRKIYPVTVSVWKPYFVGDYFRDYREVNTTHQILVAFAGSTLSAQHYLNNITDHLSFLRITFDRSLDRQIAYTITTHCDKANPMFAPGIYFGDDTFTPADMAAFRPTAEQIAQTILHALKHAMKSAAKYKIDAAGNQSLKTPFVAGIQCPASLAYKVFKFEIYEKPGSLPIEMDVSITCIPPDEVAVLGMGKRFDARAQEVYTAARTSGRDTGMEAFTFLNAAIDEVKKMGRPEIDRPSVLRRLRDGDITGLRKADDPKIADTTDSSDL